MSAQENHEPPPTASDGSAASSDAHNAADRARAEKRKVSEQKWGSDTIKVGYIIVPAVLARHQRRLGLKAMDFNVLVQLIDHWWEPEDKVFPAKDTIAKRMNVSGSTIQRCVVRLEALGLVERVERFGADHQQTSNVYRLDGLIGKLAEIAKEDLAIKEVRAVEDAKRGRRRGARSGTSA